jgi:starch synthase
LKINALRRGILHADVVCTVSPTYAQEIMTPQYGELLDSLLKERRARVYGIMNGLNYDDFNPDTDAYIAENYTADTLDNRSANKAELQRRFGLTVSRNSFLIGIVSRLIEQKGFELLFDTIEPLFKELDIQLAVQGSGDSKFMGFFKSLEEKFPGRVGTNLVFDPIMPRIVYGGADAILIPSKFEPSGLTQLEAMRYGAVPIARKTGGLADTVHDYNESSDSGNGFIFKEFDSMAMMIAIIRAYENFRHKPIWRGIQRRGMLKDFSWNRSAAEYTHLFNVALGFRRKTKEE